MYIRTMKNTTAVPADIVCPTHGATMGPSNAGTPEQAYCGQWFRCERCTTSVLIPSAGLVADLARMGSK